MFQVNTFLQDQFASPDGVVALAGKHCGDAPQREAVRKWFARASLPGDWALALVFALQQENGQVPDLKKYMADAKNDRDTEDIFA